MNGIEIARMESSPESSRVAYLQLKREISPSLGFRPRTGDPTIRKKQEKKEWER
jgi:hypothetical protein